jgi:hypothetical protein
VRHAIVILKHPPVTAEPVAAFHVRRCPSKEQLAEAQPRDEHVGLVDLARFDLVPLDGLTRVIDFNPLAGLELSSGDGRFAVLRELMTWTLPASTGQLCQIARCVGHSITEQEE